MSGFLSDLVCERDDKNTVLLKVSVLCVILRIRTPNTCSAFDFMNSHCIPHTAYVLHIYHLRYHPLMNVYC